MSERFDDFLNMLGPGFDPQPVRSVLSPLWSEGGLYAPINYTPPANVYQAVNTDTRGKDGAQRVNADVIRAQYQDYETRFKPIEDMAIGLLTNQGTRDLEYDLRRTQQTIGGVFANLQGQQNRAMERFGQANTQNIVGSSEEAGAMVGGLNNAVFADEQRRMKLLGGGSTTAAPVVRGNG